MKSHSDMMKEQHNELNKRARDIGGIALDEYLDKFESPHYHTKIMRSNLRMHNPHDKEGNITIGGEKV